MKASGLNQVLSHRMSSASAMDLNCDATTAANPQGAATVLVAGAGERQLTLSRYDNGVVKVALSPSPLTQLVLSGGGAKGTAFPGVLHALENKGVWRGIKVVHGSSAGGISAALMASGLGAKAFDTLSDRIDLPELLNSSNSPVAWLQNTGSTLGKVAGRLPGKAGTAAQLLLTLMPRLQSAASPLEERIRNESCKSVLAHIANTPRGSRSAQVMAIADKLSAGGATTFADLDVLSRTIPEIKQLTITGTGMFGGRPQLVVFSADLTPDMDIARAAHISGALPVLFRSPVEQGLAFQADGETTHFQDGGLLLNTPVGEVYDREFAQSILSQKERLIIQFESESPQQPAARGGLASGLFDYVAGMPSNAARAFNDNRLKAFAEQIVTLPLNTAKGDFRGTFSGTVNFTMTGEEKDHLQRLALRAVEAHLARRVDVREEHQFASMDDALLALDDQMFASVEGALQSNGAYSEVLAFRKGVGPALQALDAAIVEANRADRLKLTPQVAAALRNLDALARRPEHIEWLGKRLNAVENRNFQQLLQALAKTPSGELTLPPNRQGAGLSKVMRFAIAEMKRRDTAVIADRLTRELIYPSRFLPGQSDSNLELLRQAEQRLSQAVAASDVNRVLDDIVRGYEVRNNFWKMPLHDETIGMAKAWRLPS